jgi:4-amino-4-deoxy-L-arabinose transferase-like glycosyltransferase
MKPNSILKKPFFLFLPFLAVYTVIVFLFQTKGMVGDEGRYIIDANNLLHGFFSPPAPGIRLYNGPGYPILLMPFQWLHLPITAIRLLNPVFLYLSLVLLYKSLEYFVPLKKNILCCLFLACYFNTFIYLAIAIPEIIALFLITLLTFLLIKAFSENGRRKHLVLAGLVFGFLCLTKVIFGYVLACMVAVALLFWILKRTSANNRRVITVLLVACLSVAPYLAYTYKITGRFFYWSSFGGNNLYWMTTPHKDETGSWFSQPEIENGVLVTGKLQYAGQLNEGEKNNSGYVPGHRDSIIKHNQADLLEIVKQDGNTLALDDAYRSAAIKNIQKYPVKFLTNCFSNIGRLLFNFPYTYSLQKPGTLVRLPLNGAIVFLFLFCLYPAIRNWSKIPLAIRFMFFVSLLYFGGSILGSAEIRMFNPLVPPLLIFIAYVLGKVIKLQPLKWGNKSE